MSDKFGTRDADDPWRLKFNDDPVCPYCDHRKRDAWELDCGPGLEGSTEVDCGSCGREYFVERCATVTYTTAPIEGQAELCGHCRHPHHAGPCGVMVDKDRGGVAGEAACNCEDDE